MTLGISILVAVAISNFSLDRGYLEFYEQRNAKSVVLCYLAVMVAGATSGWLGWWTATATLRTELISGPEWAQGIAYGVTGFATVRLGVSLIPAGGSENATQLLKGGVSRFQQLLDRSTSRVICTWIQSASDEEIFYDVLDMHDRYIKQSGLFNDQEIAKREKELRDCLGAAGGRRQLVFAFKDFIETHAKPAGSGIVLRRNDLLQTRRP